MRLLSLSLLSSGSVFTDSRVCQKPSQGTLHLGLCGLVYFLFDLPDGALLLEPLHFGGSWPAVLSPWPPPCWGLAQPPGSCQWEWAGPWGAAVTLQPSFLLSFPGASAPPCLWCLGTGVFSCCVCLGGLGGACSALVHQKLDVLVALPSDTGRLFGRFSSLLSSVLFLICEH